MSLALSIRHLAFAGANRGLFAFGVVNEWDHYDGSITYGLTPSAYDNTFITQLNLNFDRELHMSKDGLSWRLGLGAHYNASDKTFIDLPGHYPEGYYPQNALYFSLNNSIKWNNFSVEVSILDYYFEVAGKNLDKNWNLSKSFSLGFGYFL